MTEMMGGEGMGGMDGGFDAPDPGFDAPAEMEWGEADAAAMDAPAETDWGEADTTAMAVGEPVVDTPPTTDAPAEMEWGETSTPAEMTWDEGDAPGEMEWGKADETAIGAPDEMDWGEKSDATVKVEEAVAADVHAVESSETQATEFDSQEPATTEVIDAMPAADEAGGAAIEALEPTEAGTEAVAVETTDVAAIESVAAEAGEAVAADAEPEIVQAAEVEAAEIAATEPAAVEVADTEAGAEQTIAEETAKVEAEPAMGEAAEVVAADAGPVAGEAAEGKMTEVERLPEAGVDKENEPSADAMTPGAAQQGDYSYPRHQKGAELEEAEVALIEADNDKVLLSAHDRVTEPGFDPVYFDKTTGNFVITEAKNYGSEDKPGYIGDVSAWDEAHFQKNWDNLSTKIDQANVEPATKEAMLRAYINEDYEKALVIGPHTKVSDAKLDHYGVDRVVRLDPADLSSVKVEERASTRKP